MITKEEKNMDKLLAWFVIIIIFISQNIFAATNYVSKTGAHVLPFDSWVNAATNIQSAVDEASAGDTVLINVGIYYPANQIFVTNDITVKSINGAEKTIVNGGFPAQTNRCFYINGNSIIDELKLEDFKKKHASYPRNPIIADVLFKAGLIETWGRGTLKIIEECKKAGLPDPKFEEINGGIAVSLFKDKFSEHWLLQQNLNKRQIKAVCYTKENEFITNSIYQKICETSERTALRDLEQLIDKQIFNKTGEKKGTKYKLNYGG